jgi:DNA-binding NtrC family response regulator
LQGVLLQLVEEGTFTPLGDVREIRVDVRVIAATNADLSARVAEGRFRADLLDRLGRQGVQMPALAEHREDFPLLVAAILPRKAREAGPAVRDPTPGELELLMAHDWPGNVRELERAVEEFVGFGAFPEEIGVRVERPRQREGAEASRAVQLPRGAQASDRRQVVESALAVAGGSLSRAAALLGVHRNTVRRWWRDGQRCKGTAG